MRKEKIRIKGYGGSWYVIDEKECDGERLYLLESEQYGDETLGLIVDEDYKIVIDEVWNGWLDYDEWKEWEAEKAKYESEYEEDEYTSSTNGDYGPGNPWDAPGMSIKDFI